MGHGLVLFKLSRFCTVNLLIESIGSSWATNITIHYFSSLCARNYCDIHIST